MRWTLAFLAPLLVSAEIPRIVVQNADPQLAAFSHELVPLCKQWYPKIAEILYGSSPPNPPAEIRIIFDEDKSAGRAKGYEIHLSAAAANRPARLDYRAVVIHELVHIVQSYPSARCDGLRVVGCFLTGRYPYGPTWITEGIADYVTYTFFTGTNKPLLQLNAEGGLYGYDESIPYLHGLQESKLALNAAYAPRGVQAGKGYQHGYTVSASFSLWLEKYKDRQIIRKLNNAMKANSYRSRFWRRTFGNGLDRMWSDFLRASMEARR